MSALIIAIIFDDVRYIKEFFCVLISLSESIILLRMFRARGVYLVEILLYKERNNVIDHHLNEISKCQKKFYILFEINLISL